MSASLVSAWSRFVSNARISWVSSTAFASVGTAVTTLIALPLLDVVMAVLLGADVATPDLLRTGYAAGLVATVASVVGGVAGAVVNDRNLGIFEYVHIYRSIDPAYWLAKAVMPSLLSIITGIVLFVSVLAGDILVNGAQQADWQMFWLSMLLLPVALLVGLCLGIGVSGVGVALPDPYLAATIASALLPLSAGVVVPVGNYPSWLLPLTVLLPSSGMVGVLSGHSAALVTDLCASALWIALGVLATAVALRQMHNGVRRESL